MNNLGCTMCILVSHPSALSTSCSSLISALKDETTRMHIVQSSSFILQPTPHTPNFGCTPLDSTSDSSQPGRNCRQPVKTPASHEQIAACQEETPVCREETPASQEETSASQEETSASQEETRASQEVCQFRALGRTQS